jgi:hypothetical protein
MTRVGRALALGLGSILVICSMQAAAQGDPRDALLKRLNAEFPPTKFKADYSDIVTQGAVVTLQKDGLYLYPATVQAPPINTYKPGAAKLSIGFGDALKVCMADSVGVEGGCNALAHKTLVTGEKTWVGGITIGKDSIHVKLVTDAYDNDGRYSGEVKFPLGKGGNLPSPDEAVKMISEVLAAEQTQPQASAQKQNAPAPEPVQTPPPAPVLAPVAPPPPPADAVPPTVSMGQTEDQVIAAFGQPLRKATAGTKDIFSYKDLKVTFTKGKVTNVE